MDILDDDLDLGYTKQMAIGGRLNKMKKVTRKSQAKSTINKSQIKPQKDQFDDLLDDMLSKEDHKYSKKTPTALNQRPPQNLQIKDSSDDIWGEMSLTSKLDQPNINIINNNLRTKPIKVKQSFDDEIISEDNFGKTQLLVNSPKKIQPTSSMRNMKPPLRKRNSIQKNPFVVNEIDNQPEIKIHLLDKNQQSKIVIDQSCQKSKDALFSYSNRRDKQSNQSLVLQKQKHKNQGYLISPPQYNENKSLFISQSQFGIKEENKLINQQNRILVKDHEKQIQQMRKNFQKQLSFLQENLDKQMEINRNTRQKLMNQTNTIIETQRQRLNQVHREEIQRLKEMFKWQKTKIQDIYKSQITSLKNSLQYANEMVKVAKTTERPSDRTQVEYLSHQLRNQRKIVQDKEQLLTKRQLDLEEKETQFNKKRRQTEERIREEQKRILEMETKMKKQVMEERKEMLNQKQHIAMQMAKIQIQAVKKKEKINFDISEVKMQTEAVNKEKYNTRQMNQQMIQNYKNKMQELHQERQNIRQLEIDLINKIRVVEMIGLERKNEVQKVDGSKLVLKDNNWIKKEKRQIEKLNKYQDPNKQTDGIRIQQKFNKLSLATKNHIFVHQPEQKKFNIEDYIYPAEKYNKHKLNNY